MQRKRFLSIWGALAVCLLSGERALGQSAVPASRDFLVNGSRSATDSPPLDYWVVGTHGCSQRDIPSCNAAQLVYRHIGPDGRADRLGVGVFRDWLQPGVPVCIVVHGSYTSREGLLRESDEVYRWIRGAAPDRPLQVVFFTWPSEPPTLVLFQLDVGILGRRASYNGFYLADFVRKLPPECPVSFFGHSHGTRTVSAALHLLAGGQVLHRRLRSPPGWTRPMRSVLAAAAIDRHWLIPGERFGRALYPVESLLVVRNRDDPALAVYPIRRPFSNRALGEAGWPFTEIQPTGRGSQKVHELDVTPLIGAGHFWHHYFRYPQIAQAMAPFLSFEDDSGLPDYATRSGHATTARMPRLGRAAAREWQRVHILHSSSATEHATLRQR